jgi:hypothetical protein
MIHINQRSHPQNGQGLQIEKITAKELVLRSLRAIVNYDILFHFSSAPATQLKPTLSSNRLDWDLVAGDALVEVQEGSDHGLPCGGWAMTLIALGLMEIGEHLELGGAGAAG